MLEDDFLMDESDILQRVDEYTLFCHYLGFEPDLGVKYHSPIRPDDNDPSFGIFRSRNFSNREFGWKDAGTGKYGDVFKLVEELMKLEYSSCTRFQILERIKQDFGLTTKMENKPLRIVNYVPKPRETIDIRVKSRTFNSLDFQFWRQFNIDQPILERYKVKPISCYWSFESQQSPKFPRGLGYWYQIYPKSKLYFPNEVKEFKFRNDLTDKELEGFYQLKYQSDTLIITKSYKDVMCLASFGYEAVAARSENTKITDAYLQYFEQRYSRILVLFDNDGKHKADEYHYDKIWVPKDSGEKDISDFCKRYSPAETATLLKHLI